MISTFLLICFCFGHQEKWNDGAETIDQEERRGPQFQTLMKRWFFIVVDVFFKSQQGQKQRQSMKKSTNMKDSVLGHVSILFPSGQQILR